MSLPIKLLIVVLYTGAVASIAFNVGMRYERAERVKELKEQAELDESNDGKSSEARIEAGQRGAQAQLSNEVASNEGQERVRTVYSTITVPADCRQHPDVVREVRAAGERANCSVRAAAGIPCPAVPGRQ